ncbi:MAG: pyridoxal-phosphate dependent enzyme [Nitrososphaeria archaeon]
MKFYLKCTKCGERYDSDYAWPRCSKCGGLLEVTYEYESIELPSDFKTAFVKQWKYKPFMPIKRRPVTAGEGGTRLKKVASVPDVYLKIELDNPTKSFKDRGSTVEVTRALELGYQRLVVASTGNMALSVSAYSEIAGLETVTFVGSGANQNKIDMIRNKGGKIIQVEGDFNDALLEAEKFAKKTKSFLVGDYLYRKEGQKGVIFEVIDQLSYNPPDYVFVPVGNGTLISATYKGLYEYKLFGLIDKMPKIIGVQAKGADAFYRYYKTGKLKKVKVKTAADAIAVGLPTYSDQAKEAVKATNGDVITVSEKEMAKAVKEIYKLAQVCSELGGAAAYAGLLKYDLPKDSKAVAFVTGGNI